MKCNTDQSQFTQPNINNNRPWFNSTGGILFIIPIPEMLADKDDEQK